jgi:uncharacterized protein (DUF58 family)
MKDVTTSKDEMVDEVDAEVRRVSKVFRFILKYREQFRPSGIEFSDLRSYNNDDASRIDWNSSARLNDLYVKEYEEVQDMDVFIVLDVSDSMTFGTAEKLKSEYCAVLTSTLAYASVDMAVDVGVGLFGENEEFIVPDSGEAQYQKILGEVTDPENYGGEFDLERALDQVMKRIKENTFIFIVSDLIEPGEGWEPIMKVMSEKYRNVFNLMVRDLRDFKLPETGNVRFQAPDGEQELIVNTNRVKDKFEAEVEEQEEELESNIKESGADFLKINTRDNFAAQLMSYFDMRSGEW